MGAVPRADVVRLFALVTLYALLGLSLWRHPEPRDLRGLAFPKRVDGWLRAAPLCRVVGAAAPEKCAATAVQAAGRASAKCYTTLAQFRGALC
ncbi:hypothetical protein M885DRAFT_505904 [Pelagophyceae sp. CCMP2097]|nr:hypothetical protein M885DRAFT_505904 [Pelagophyceae sp. CCMP2097]